MDCRAMAVSTSLQGSGYGAAHSFRSELLLGGRRDGSQQCGGSLVRDGHQAQQLPSLQVRIDCRSKRAPLHSLGRNSGYGAKVFTILESCRQSLRSIGCVGSSEEVATSTKDLDEKNASVEELEEEEDDEGDAWLVHEATTPFNKITVLELDEAADHELAGAYVLKLDNADLAHSVYWSNGKVWTIGCHDVFASLPPLLPEGPIGILGLGAGTVARLLLHIWPSLHLEGWELDPEVIRVARDYFGLADLESPEDSPVRGKLSLKEKSPAEIKASQPKKTRSKKKGRLVVHVGDALGSRATVKGGFAGIMVDIFINGSVCKELADVSTWENLKLRLRPGGRIMVNCIPNSGHLQEDSVVSKEWDEVMHRIARAMELVFSGEVSVRELTDGNNVMLLSGEAPDVEMWAEKVPDRLKQGVGEWKLWGESHPRYCADPKTLVKE